MGSDSAQSPPSQTPLHKGRLYQRQCCASLEIICSLEPSTERSLEVTRSQQSRTKSRVTGHTVPGNHQRPVQHGGGSALPWLPGLQGGQAPCLLSSNIPDALTPSCWKMLTQHRYVHLLAEKVLKKKKERLFSAPSTRMHIRTKSPAFTLLFGKEQMPKCSQISGSPEICTFGEAAASGVLHRARTNSRKQTVKCLGIF